MSVVEVGVTTAVAAVAVELMIALLLDSRCSSASTSPDRLRPLLVARWDANIDDDDDGMGAADEYEVDEGWNELDRRE